MSQPSETTLYSARFDDLDVRTLYALLKLRSDVFVVEQACPYPELDGRDVEPGTRHLWLAPAGEPARPRAYLRILAEPDGGRRIGRVCTAFGHRGSGLSAALMRAALDDRSADGVPADGSFVLDAQSYLVGFYGRFGFVADGTEFLEDGIAHTPMRKG